MLQASAQHSRSSCEECSEKNNISKSSPKQHSIQKEQCAKASMPLEVQATTRPLHRGNSITSAVTAGVEEPGAVQHGDTANSGWKETLSEGKFVSHTVEGHSTAPSMHRLYSKPLNSSNSPRDPLPGITCLPPHVSLSPARAIKLESNKHIPKDVLIHSLTDAT